MDNASKRNPIDGGEASSLAPWMILRRMLKHRYVIRQLAWKSIMSSYGGSMGGLLWVALKPLLMLSVYTYVFGVIFHARFYKGPGPADPIEFALALFVGLSVFTVFSEMVGKSPTLILSNVNFVKKMVFPLDMLVVAEMGASIFNYLVSLAIFIVFMIFHYGSVRLTALYTPILVFPFLMTTLGFSWILASLGVYFRDIAQITGILISILMFLSPIFFPISSLPPAAQQYMYLNPVSDVVEETRSVFFVGTMPDVAVLARHYVVGGLAMWLGWIWFRKTRKGFADVL